MRPSRRPFTGQSLVEMALIVPVFTLLLMGTVDLGRVFYTEITIANASRTAALFAANWRERQKYPNNASGTTAANDAVKTVARREAAPFVTLALSDISFTSDWQPGTIYTVTVTTNFNAITPIVSQLWGGGALQLSHSTQMRHSCTYLSVANPALCTYPAP